MRRLAEKDLDRVPVEARGNRRTIQMAEAEVLKTAKGKELYHVVKDAGLDGMNAYAKTFPR